MAAEALARVEVRSLAEWRAWLAEHHGQAESVWVVTRKKGRGPHVPYGDIRDEALCRARTCYDHLAGRLGVALADSLTGRGFVRLDEDGGEVTAVGAAFLDRLGIGLAGLARRHARAFCRPCLDWSERRSHLAGAVGNAIAARCFELGWIQRIRDTRAVNVTVKGSGGLRETFGIDFAPAAKR